MAAKNTITYDRGTTYTIGVNYTNQNGVAGSKALFTVKKTTDSDSTDAAAIFQQDATMTANAATITISPSSIAPTVAAGTYLYDVKVLDANGQIYLIQSGNFVVVATPTNRLT